jgi:probable O-glycosylation ligase (exosortase A-associated)
VRDAALVALCLVLLVLALRRGFNAYLLWGWAGLFAFDNYVFGFMRDVSLGLVFATLLPLSLLWAKKLLDFRYGGGALSGWLVALAFHALLCAALAEPDLQRNWEILSNVLKIVLFCLLMPFFVRSSLRLTTLVACICLSSGFHAVVDGLKFIASGTGHIVVGMPKYGDNNHIALIWVMVIPLWLFLAQRLRQWTLRAACLGSAVITALAVVATNSRGGLIALSTLAVWQIATGRRKLLVALVFASTALALVSVAPERWETRMGSLSEAQSDDSFLGRVVAWRVSSAIALAHPLFGGGFHAVENGAIWTRYRDSPGLLGFLDLPEIQPIPGAGKAAHSIYFEVLGDQGFPGLAIFVSIFLCSLIYARRLSALARCGGRAYRWADEYAKAVSGSLVVYMVGGAALSAAYFELGYILAMSLLVALRVAEESIERNTARQESIVEWEPHLKHRPIVRSSCVESRHNS